MIRRMAFVACVLALAPIAARAEENPYKSAKKGDWVAYNMSVSAMGFDLKGAITQKVIEKDDKSLTLEVTGKINDMDIPAQKQTIDLTKPFNPLGAANFPAGANSKVEKKESGKEKVKVGDKEYDCEWTSYKVSADAGGMKIEADVKTWSSKDVPLAGMVKMEMKSMQANVTMVMEKAGKE
jgi:hypothetical protein